jgi:serine protease
MPRAGYVAAIILLGCCCAAFVAGPAGAAVEYNPMRATPVSIGPEAHRLIVGFRATTVDAAASIVRVTRKQRLFTLTQAHTTPEDAQALARRSSLYIAGSRQITPSVHVLFLTKTLYGAAVDAALAALRHDPQVAFATVDRRRYALGAAGIPPDDPLFVPTAGASGQWYLNTPSSTPVTLEGVTTTDLSATDTISAWGLTTGSTGIVIADVDTGVLFEHPDLLRAGPASLGAGFGGRLLPGYDFVGQDYDPSNGEALSTFLIANDGDGWDPDPADPGDWISSQDTQNALFAKDSVVPSTWHGTRVVGVFGAIANNGQGLAGLTWGSWVLPVRALGKGGGYDSDIIAAVQWAAGLAVTNPDGTPLANNPYPADIINLSIGGGTDACTSTDGMAYQTALNQVTGMGVLVVVAAGNGGTPGQSAPVELPANCAGVVPGVIAVAGLRNVGTKVGYSSFGPEVSVSAPAGNCVVTTGDCLRSIDTTTNLGTTVPAGSSYTNETNPNLGTSFATPIVSGIAALMRSANYNLTPMQLAVRLEKSASAFPAGASGLPTCPANDPTSGECACPNDGSQCGAGMVNAYHAVLAALAPIAAVAVPGITAGAPAVLDGSGSAPACGRSIAGYAWAVTSGTVAIVSGANTSKVTIMPAQGTLTLTVTDNKGATDTATIVVTASSASTSAPASAGTASSACPALLDPNPIPPTVSPAFSPVEVPPGTSSALTITLRNDNSFVLTQARFTNALPTGLNLASATMPATTCPGIGVAVSADGNVVSLTNANIPAHSYCTVTMMVSSSINAVYTNAIPANALMTGPAGGSGAASATLTVGTPAATAQAASGGGGGGGDFDWLDGMFIVGVLLAGRRRPKKTGNRS